MVILVTVYCIVFALAYAWALVWILERREKKYGQGSFSFTDAFLVASLVGMMVYFTNTIVIMAWPASALFYDLVLLAGLGAFGIYKETAYKARAARVSRRQRAEARLLERYVANDPANAAYFERLSEVYEKLGEKDKALAAARMAAKLDPAVRNAWRVKMLEEK